MSIVSVYNFCMNVSDLVGLSVSECFRRSLDLYDDGAILKAYNTKAENIVRDILKLEY